MAIQPTHKPDPRDVDAAWDESRGRQLDAAWDRYQHREAAARTARHAYEEALEDPEAAVDSIYVCVRLNAHAQAQIALDDAADALRRLGEDPALYDPGENDSYPTPHGLI